MLHDVARALPEDFREIGKAVRFDRRGRDDRLETHAPHIAPTIVVFRLNEDRERVRKMRTLIKELEQIEVDELLRQLRGGRLRRVTHSWLSSAAFGVALRDQIAARSRAASERLHHATGIYFPKRAAA